GGAPTGVQFRIPRVFPFPEAPRRRVPVAREPSATAQCITAPIDSRCAFEPPAATDHADGIEKGPNVEIENPVIAPASLPCYSRGLERRLVRPIPIESEWKCLSNSGSR